MLESLSLCFELFFKTWFLIIVGIGSGITLLIHRWKRDGQLNDAGLLDFGSIAFNTLSVLGGLRLCGIALKTAYVAGQSVVMNAIYTVYGGIAVIWLSIKNISKKWTEQPIPH